MTLLELLVKELPKRGGWPDRVKEVWQDYDGEVRPLGFKTNVLSDNYRRQHHDAEVKIGKKQYEAAIAASQQPVWSGEGLPPVGCDVELVNHFGEDFPEFVGETGERVKIIGNGFTNSRPVAFYEADGGRGNILSYAVAECFRPIRTEAERRRDTRIKAINSFMEGFMKNRPGDFSGLAAALYDYLALFDKLEDS